MFVWVHYASWIWVGVEEREESDCRFFWTFKGGFLVLVFVIFYLMSIFSQIIFSVITIGFLESAEKER